MTAASDMELLGECPPPETFTNESLAQINPKSLRRSITQKPFQIFFENRREGLPFPKAWTSSVHEFYLKGAGISEPFPQRGRPYLFTYSEETAKSVLERNPQLKQAGYKFDFQKPGRPFLSFDISLHGPITHIPIDTFNKSYPTMEVNPLFTGTVVFKDGTFVSSEDVDPISFEVGGAVETYAFASKAPSSLKYQLLPPYAQTGVITGVPLPSDPFTLSHANGIGGWAVASGLATLSSESLNNRLGQLYDYWSPSKTVLDSEHVFGDGGLTDNWNLFQILRREEVERFVIVTASSVSLNMSYDASERPPTETDIDSMISSSFGLDPQAITNSFHYRENHVFETDQFVELIDKLTSAAREGTGIIATMDCDVVDNEHYGIKGGRSVEVMFVYLGRVFAWEDKLPADLREELFEPVRDTSVLKGRRESKYPGFPNIPLFPLDMPPEQANLLANLQGWVVKNNSQLFMDFLG
uniref:PNPLA domain-containing protein n=1 Tax=Lotharella oceanica TaxID=641309 RepID=A0A7S2XGV5_9EUKA